MAEFRVETERLVLRDWREEDRTALDAIRCDPDMTRWLGDPGLRGGETDIIPLLQERSRRDGHTMWAMEHKADGKLVGWCGAKVGNDGPAEGHLELGWAVAPEWQGNGYATEAARAVLAWIAVNRPGSEVWATTTPGNARSRAVMKRLGMRACPELEFDRPEMPVDHPLRRHIPYRLEVVQ